jgi:hypothetical protein
MRPGLCVFSNIFEKSHRKSYPKVLDKAYADCATLVVERAERIGLSAKDKKGDKRWRRSETTSSRI